MTVFASALRRLTVLYTLVQLLVFGALAIGIYLFVTWTFDLDLATQDGTAVANVAELGFSRLRAALLVGFGVLCVIVPFTSYWMARAALAPLRRSVEQQQRFIDDASHELRSPLTVIRGELELALSRPRRSEDYRQSITSTLDATQSLVQLSDDLLLLAREEPEQLRARFAPVSIDSVIEEAVRTTTDGASRVTIGSSSGLMVHGISALLVRALANVLDNALKFTPVDGSITVSPSAGPRIVTISVADTGIGMTAEEVGHARDRFWRGGRAHSSAGHGLGLSVVERIVRTHHGHLRITSTPGAGSLIDLVLPAPPST